MTVWERGGTASVETGATAVTGTLTIWNSRALPGDGITFDGGGKWYEISSIGGNTALTLATPFAEATVVAGAYAIDRKSSRRGDVSNALVLVQDLLGKITTLLLTSGPPDDGIGNDGAIAFDADEQTFYFKAGGHWDAGTHFKGDGGWSPLFAVVADGDRQVLQIASWVGGDGDPPAVGAYVGAEGLVEDIEDAAQVSGSNGWTPVLALVADGARIVQQLVSWTGGTGAPPDSPRYVGVSGYVTDIGAAVDVRGIAGQSMRPDAVVDDIADRAAYDESAAFTCVLVLYNVEAELAPTLYFLLTPDNVSPVWSVGIPFLELTPSGATPGTYGSASAVPVVTVDAQGRITNVSTASIPDPVAMAIVFGA